MTARFTPPELPENIAEDLLLLFSTELAAVKDPEQLRAVFDTWLKDILTFNYSTVYAIDTKDNTLFNFLPSADGDINGSLFKFKVASKINDEITPELQDFLSTRALLRFNDGLVVSLNQGGQRVGFWVMAYERHATPAREQETLVRLIANQLAMVLLMLKAEGTTKEREAESEIIQSLNIDFASIKEKKDLLKIIHFKLKKLFEFGHHWVAIINEDQLSMTSFLQDEHSRAKDHPKYQQVIKARYTTNDRIFNKVLLSKDPVVFDLQQLSKRGAMPEYMQILFESGVTKVVMVGLQVGSRIIGVWAICLIEDQTMDCRQLNLISGISNQLSIAVDNIIINDAIAKREAEADLLLKLSYDISTVRSKKDLVKVINTDLRKIFHFENICIFMLNEERNQDSFVLLSAYDQIAIQMDSALDINEDTLNCLDRMLQTEGVQVFDMEELSRHEKSPQQVKLEFESGIMEKVTVTLKEGDKYLGVFCVNSMVKGAYSDHDLELIKGVAYQISTAVSNIMANEEISRREAERELLLSLSIDIGTIRNNHELLKMINNRFKSMLGFCHTAIVTISQDKTFANAFLKDPDSRSRNHPDYPRVSNGNFQINDGILNRAICQSKPILFNLQDLAGQMTLPCYMHVNMESGIKQAAVVRLSKGMEIYGFWLIFYDRLCVNYSSKLNLIESLANQISVAVLNIIANEEIEKKESEKSRLLAFSNAIASVRDKNLLAKVLKAQLKDLFGISDYGIHALSADKKKHSPILFDADSRFASHPDFKKMLGVETSIYDGVFDTIIASPDPVVFNVSDWARLPLQPSYSKILEAGGTRQMIGVCIRIGQENIAVMNFKQEDGGGVHANCHLFKSILSQIAIMVCNIIANEKINNQLKEINGFKQQLEEEKTYLREELETTHNYAEIVGESPAMQKTFRLVAQVAPSDSTVLILGETGTGKELVARAIHNNSPRKNKLMVKVNCAALPANLIESELFGHERGSFTGATDRRLGKFELANGGTLFLDEIGEMPLDLQVKLLRALQEREIERIGGKGVIKVDVRIIAATNRQLEKEMEEGRFRSDLYYRLNIFPIELPPLRHRREDISLLTTHFISRFAKKAGRKIKTISNKALQDMTMYNWPGNIRELEHLIERSILLSEGDTLKTIHLPTQKNGATQASAEKDVFVIKTMDENEREYIIQVLKYCKGRVGGYLGAAELLDVPASTLFSKMKKLNIRRDIVESVK